MALLSRRDASMMWPLALLAGAILFPLAACGQPAAAPAEAKAGEEIKGDKWVRAKLDKNQKPVALEVAIVRYVPKAMQRRGNASPQYVDLVGAVHIGDLDYYEELNRRFRQYDAVLYELVAPEGTVVERGRGTSNLHPLGAMQNGMKTMLEVEHQLEQIDYMRPNFVHADLTPEEFSESMANREEGWVQLYFRLMGQAVAEQSRQTAEGESLDADVMMALFSEDRARLLKVALAKQFESMESMLTGFSGPEGSTLITVRNQRALEVLRREQAAGKHKLAIFYGAGHLSDMHKRLVDEFDMVPVSLTWLEAWDLREK